MFQSINSMFYSFCHGCHGLQYHQDRLRDELLWVFAEFIYPFIQHIVTEFFLHARPCSNHWSIIWLIELSPGEEHWSLRDLQPEISTNPRHIWLHWKTGRPQDWPQAEVFMVPPRSHGVYDEWNLHECDGPEEIAIQTSMNEKAWNDYKKY